MPANGWWHEWTSNTNVKVENREASVDLGGHEGKILVWTNENWQPEPTEKVHIDIAQENTAAVTDQQ